MTCEAELGLQAVVNNAPHAKGILLPDTAPINKLYKGSYTFYSYSLADWRCTKDAVREAPNESPRARGVVRDML